MKGPLVVFTIRHARLDLPLLVKSVRQIDARRPIDLRSNVRQTAPAGCRDRGVSGQRELRAVCYYLTSTIVTLLLQFNGRCESASRLVMSSGVVVELRQRVRALAAGPPRTSSRSRSDETVIVRVRKGRDHVSHGVMVMVVGVK